MDYVELDLDGPILRLLAPPRVSFSDHAVVFPGDGSRDALCGLIGQTVERAEDKDDRLSLLFASSVEIDMPKASAGTGPEVAHLVPMTDGSLDVAAMVVWENLVPTRGNAGTG